MDDRTIDLIRNIFTILYCVLFTIGLSNVAVLIVVAAYKRMRSVTNVFIFNLCAADLLFVSTMPTVIAFTLQRNWTFGHLVCKLFFMAESVSKFVSVYFVGVLSVDRYLALCHTAWCKKYRHPKSAIMVSLLGWVLTAILMTPIQVYSGVIELNPQTNICTVKWPRDNIFLEQQGQEDESLDLNFTADYFYDKNSTTGNWTTRESSRSKEQSGQKSFTIGNHNLSTINGSNFTFEHYFAMYSFLFCFAMPALVISFFYYKIVRQMTVASRRATRLRRRDRSGTYKKVTWMVLTVVTFYFVCWSPFWLISFISTFFFVGSPDLKIRIIFNIIHALPYLNCSINPLLYTIMTQTFREAIAKSLADCPLCRNSWLRRLPMGNAKNDDIIACCDIRNNDSSRDQPWMPLVDGGQTNNDNNNNNNNNVTVETSSGATNGWHHNSRKKIGAKNVAQDGDGVDSWEVEQGMLMPRNISSSSCNLILVDNDAQISAVDVPLIHGQDN